MGDEIWLNPQNDPAINYIYKNSLRLHPSQRKLLEVTKDVPLSIMISYPHSTQFLQDLIRSIHGKRCLDIGVFTGYSSLAWALAIPDDGKVIACDIDETNPKTYGLPAWKEAGVDDKVDLRIAPAGETLQKLIDQGQSGTFDFAYIDADKVGYDNYYEQCLTLIRAGGIIALDNMLLHGKVFDDTVQDEDTVALRNLNQKIHKDERVFSSLLKLGDGTQIVFKK